MFETIVVTLKVKKRDIGNEHAPYWKTCFKRDWRIRCRFVPNLSEYVPI